jgi:cytochrome c peroxidase
MLKGIRRAPSLWLVCAAAAALPACRPASPADIQRDDIGASIPTPAGPISPVPAPVTLAADAPRVALGRRLFDEPRLSHDDTIACSTCHVLAHGGVDGQAHAIGIGGKVGDVNTPTVFNAALNFRQFWDGRAATLESQIAGPLHNPVEMGSSFAEAIAKLAHDPSYARQTRAAYGTPTLTATLLTDAIAAYERTLVSTGARFDRFLAGDSLAIDGDERHGYELFVSYGCASCHQGANVGGNMFERFGVTRDYFGDIPNPTRADLGRYNVTGRAQDRYVFRVPSLRLVTLTAPYFHDGSIQTLDQAVRLMGRHQLGYELPHRDVTLIVKFLGTLVGTSREMNLAASP